MRRTQCVLVMVALFVGLAHSWDIAVSVRDELIFFTDGTKTNTVNLLSHNLTALAYDEVHNMMLYVDKQSEYDAICGYYLRSKENQCFMKRNGSNIHNIAFDPATDTLFFTDTHERSINWISLKPGSNNNVNGNLLIKMDDQTPSDIAVDSCRGYIYWSYQEERNKYMERARFDGSERKVLNIYWSTFSMAVNPQTREIHYFDGCKLCPNECLKTADLDGENRRIRFFHQHDYSAPNQLTVSKDYINWVNSSESYSTVWQYPKNAREGVEPKEISKFYTKSPLGIVANYKIKELIQGLKDCEVLWSLITSIGERCDVSVCENYCLQGDCSFNDEGLPKCRCNAGYSGERCEVYACHGYCLNNGDCSINEKSVPVCKCVGNHEGTRCEADMKNTFTNTPTYYAAKRTPTIADLLANWRKAAAKISVTVEV